MPLGRAEAAEAAQARGAGLRFPIRPPKEGASVHGVPLARPISRIPLPPTLVSHSGTSDSPGTHEGHVGLGPHRPGTVASRKEPVCLETPQAPAGPGGFGETRAGLTSKDMDLLGVRACCRGVRPPLKGLAGGWGGVSSGGTLGSLSLTSSES